jgi:hypothetical protein
MENGGEISFVKRTTHVMPTMMAPASKRKSNKKTGGPATYQVENGSRLYSDGMI